MMRMKHAGLAVIVCAALGLAACGGEKEEIRLTAEQEKQVSERLAPAGEVALESEVASAAPAAASAASAEPRSGEEVYNKSCTTCHTTGVAGAPKLGDAAAWAERVAKGIDVLHNSSINGFKGMPPMGLCMDCSEEEVIAAVDYMVENSK